MKQLIIGPIVFALCLCLLTTSITSCTVGDGKGKPPASTEATGPQHSDYRFELTTSTNQRIIADGIFYRDSVYSPNGGSPMTNRVLDYICPCGKTGTLLPPYTVDTIVYPEGTRHKQNVETVIKELPVH